MYHDLWLRRACWVSSVALVLVAGTLVQAQDVLIRRAPAAERDVFFLYGDAEATDAAPAFWIGLICNPPDDALRAQLKLKDAGLVVREVVPDAPAAKAGIKVYDVILAAGDKELRDIHGLVEAVEKSGGKEITFSLLHEGEKKTVTLTPTKREKTGRVEELPGDVRRWIELHRAGPDGWKAEMMRPGVLGMRVVAGEHKLPKDMSVTITKEGESPAKISVKQGDKKWEVTEDKLKDLPDDVRKHVAPMVRPGAAVFSQALPALPPPVSMRPFDIETGPPGARAADHRLEKQVDDLKKQLEKLQKAVEDLSKKGDKQ